MTSADAHYTLDGHMGYTIERHRMSVSHELKRRPHLQE